jgi:hypothetical protein
MADNLKEIFEEAGEFAESYELGLNTATQLLSVKDANNN